MMSTTTPVGDEAVARLRSDFDDNVREGHPIAVAAIDVDYFHDLNGREGVEVADAVLELVASRLSAGLPGGAWLGHQGGDQFFVVLPGREAEEAFLAAEQIRATVAAEPFAPEGREEEPIAVTISVGLASAPKHAHAAEALLRRATGALYRAKSLGRNRVGLPTDDRMVTKTSHYPQAQLERLKGLAKRLGCNEAEILRDALDDVLLKHKSQRPE